jgi:lysyl-tRNA synthetase class 2
MPDLPFKHASKTLTTALGLRARGLQAIRAFFEAADYLEVETPIRIPAPAPEAHIDPEPCGQAFLQTSPELCMKRIAGGRLPAPLPNLPLLSPGGARPAPFAGVHPAGMVHRGPGLPAHDGPDRSPGEARGPILRPPAAQLKFSGPDIDLQGPFERLRVDDAFRMFAGSTPEAALSDGRFDEIVGCTIEPRLGWERPVFLYDYPAACAALARLKPDQPTRAERFELYIGGIELCNGFSELNDPEEQRRRFLDELQARQQAGRPASPLPERFLAPWTGCPPPPATPWGWIA